MLLEELDELFPPRVIHCLPDDGGFLPELLSERSDCSSAFDMEDYEVLLFGEVFVPLVLSNLDPTRPVGPLPDRRIEEFASGRRRCASSSSRRISEYMACRTEHLLGLFPASVAYSHLADSPANDKPYLLFKVSRGLPMRVLMLRTRHREFLNSGSPHGVSMTEANTGQGEPVSGLVSQPDSATPTQRFAIKPDLLWKILAVLGVVFLVYILIYLGTWLAMLN